MLSVEFLNPECRDGKHRNCDGRALDVARDVFVGCDCSCHEVVAG